MNLKYLGHSCFLIRTKGRTLVVDPYLSGNPKADQTDPESIQADYVLITHGHHDHVGDAVQIAKHNSARVISNFEIVAWFASHGIKGYGMNIGGSRSFDFGTIKVVNATHSSTLPDNTPGGNPGGFVIWNEEACLYIAGDTGLHMDMRLIPMICPKLSAAILPLGDNYTMGYRDAVIAAAFIQCDRIIGCHFDTFDLIKLDHFKALAAFKAEDRELILPDIGSEINL